MVGSNAFAATDIDANGNVGGSGATCVYNVLDTYEGSSSFDAKWTPNNYTITFAKNTMDANENALYGTITGTMANQTYAYDSTANLTTNAYSITGYNFDGWSTTTNPENVSGGNATLTNSKSVTYTYPGNATLTARWVPAQSGAITLVSSVYPGNDTSQTPLYTTSTSEAVTAPTTSTVYSVYNTGLYTNDEFTTAVVAANLVPSKAGYTFGGFYNSADSTQYINSSGVVQDAATRVVTTNHGTDIWYADWAPNLYEITYKPGTAGTREVNGNSVIKGVYYDATTYRDNSTLATLANNVYSIEGYSFAGWSSDYNVTTGAHTTTLYAANTAISPYKVVGDTTMTAQWNPICYGAITLDSKKYSSSDDNTGVSPTSAASPSSIYVLYDNGIYTDNACTSTTGLTNGNITIPTLAGYSFLGFFNDKNAAVNRWARNRVIDSTGAIEVLGYANGDAGTWYAGWSPNDYTITFAKNTVDVNGTTLVAQNGTTATPTGTMSDQTYTYDSTANLTANAYSLTGYNFGGWSTTTNPANVNGGNATLTDGQSVTYVYPDDVTLTARWNPVKSGAITLNSSVYPGNDTSQTPLYTTLTGVTAPTTTTVYSKYNTGLYSNSNGTTAVVAANLRPSKVGYTFNGFYNSAISTQYINSSGVVQATGKRAVTTTDGTDTWYAKWSPIRTSLKYGCGEIPQVKGLKITNDPMKPPIAMIAYDSSVTIASDLTNLRGCDLSGDRGGFHFGGWSCDRDPETGTAGTTTYASAFDTIHSVWSVNKTVNPWHATRDVTCTSIWTGNDYTISYDHGTAGRRESGFSGTMSNQSVTFGDDVTLTTNAFSIPGYTFDNWIGDYDNRTGVETDTAYTNGQQLTYILPNNLSLTAQWTPINYKITFEKNTVDTNGNALYGTVEGTMADQIYAYDSTANLTTNAYSITGYNFGGWTGNKNVRTEAGNTGSMTYTNAESITYVHPANATLTARWSPVKSGAITLNSNVYPGNDRTQNALYTTSTGVTAPTTTTVYSVYNTGLYSDSAGTTDVVAANLIPSKVGYTFAGFYNSAGSTQYINSSGAVQDAGKRAVTSDNGTDTWYTNWTANTYTITYNCGDGTGSLPTGSQYTTATYDAQFTPPANTCTAPTGYQFTGWLVSGTQTTVNSAFDWQYTENKTLTAQWEPKTKAITYGCGTKPQGASTNVTGYGPSNGSAVFGSTYSLSSSFGTCALPGYHATGWDCSGGATLSNANGTQSALAIDDDIACNVHWVANNIITNWDGNVGTIGTAGSDSCDYDGDITLPSSVTRPGFVLNGWTVTNSATLPSGYTRLDYLQSNGGPLISTEINYDATKRITLNLTAYSDYVPSSNMICAGFGESRGQWFGVSTGGKWTCGSGAISTISTSNMTSNIEITWNSGVQSLNIGGTSIGQRTISSDATTSLKLFGFNSSGVFRGRIYSARLFIDNILVHTYIPCRRNTDSVLGMCDIANNGDFTFRTNIRTGTFVAGPPAQ